MLAYIGISLLAIFALITAIRWGTEKAGFSFPKRFWTVCFLSVIVVTMIVPRIVLGMFGLGWTLLFSFFLLFLVALWISFAFLPIQKLAMEECFIVEELSAADESLPPAVDEVFVLPANMDLLQAEALHNEDTSTLINTLPLVMEATLPQQDEPDNDQYLPSLNEAMTAFAALEQQVATRFDSSEVPSTPEVSFDHLTESFDSFEAIADDEPVPVAVETVADEQKTTDNNEALFPSFSLEATKTEANDEVELATLEDTLIAAENGIQDSVLTQDEWIEPEPIAEETATMTLQASPLAESSPDELAPVEVEETPAEQIEENRLLPTQEPEVEENVIGTVERSLPKSDSLEDLLDYALMQRSRKQFSEALSAIQAAVLLYGEKDPDSLPYLIIELANIHKEQGNYEQAIQAFQEGQNQLTGEAFKPWREQFIVSIAYLRIVRNTLIAHHQPMMPIDSLPASLKEEIEDEFAEWNRLS